MWFSCTVDVYKRQTFSWWGQWLAGVPGRCVIAPDRWYAKGKKTALYDHDWTLTVSYTHLAVYKRQIQYYLRFWLRSCRTSLAVSALRLMRYCL